MFALGKSRSFSCSRYSSQNEIELSVSQSSLMHLDIKSERKVVDSRSRHHLRDIFSRQAHIVVREIGVVWGQLRMSEPIADFFSDSGTTHSLAKMLAHSSSKWVEARVRLPASGSRGASRRRFGERHIWGLARADEGGRYTR